MEDCVFCKIIKKEIEAPIVWENDSYIAFLDQHPIQPGHTLVVPKKHTDYIFDLEDSEYTELMLMAKDMAKKMKLTSNAKRIGMAVEGFGVPHVHVHLVPINNSGDLSVIFSGNVQ